MIVSVLVARSITQPIGEMREQAIRIARGDYSRKVKVHGQDELGQLADTFNQLAERIEEAKIQWKLNAIVWIACYPI